MTGSLPNDPPSIPPPSDGLTILHRTDDYAIIDKPHGLHSVPGRGDDKQDSIETRARLAFPDATGPMMIHRLDMETSGLMVIALTKDAHRKIQSQFMSRKVGKTYDAILDGTVTDDEGAIDFPLYVDWPNRPRQRLDRENGKPARTLYRVTHRTDATTRVEFRPVTGRTHQLRVHAATSRDQGGLGCPILGDTLYGDPHAAPRLMLHANMLAFWEPGTNAWVKFTSEASWDGPSSTTTDR